MSIETPESLAERAAFERGEKHMEAVLERTVIAQLRDQRDSALRRAELVEAEAVRVSRLWIALKTALGEPECHERAMERAEALQGRLAAVRSAGKELERLMGLSCGWHRPECTCVYCFARRGWKEACGK